MNNIYLIVFGSFLLLFFNRKLVNNELWRATITPLASIIGSGFLIAAPILNSLYAEKSYLFMMILCLISFSIGVVIRWNISDIEDKHENYRTEKLSDIFLSFAYIMSVTYYLYLLSSFILKATGLQGLYIEKGFTSLLLCSIAYYGHQHGFKSLEKIEAVSVNVKLSIILTFLVALGLFNFQHDIPQATDKTLDFKSIRILLGLVIMVQGFETSRYLGKTYNKRTRITSMRNAQFFSTGIYLAFILLFAGVFILHPLGTDVSETSVIDSARYVFQMAPMMLLLAALASQLSAALADMSGCGGLVSEFSRGILSERNTYPVIAALSLILIWSFNIFEVISLSSKGFALYYSLQCASAVRYFYGKSLPRMLFSLVVGIVCLSIVILGVPFE